ncbi:hypothetical protein GCM10011371_26260 [Novosphingobium marinum]|uniref:S-adenosylmethionine uptake transporter n=1 Tax=Novosphingobium marinum TaxID=1514948 RepID=A0A7Z0BT26_9SPHN|nr:DMT family transporter [Novosphingobium marinum]NYH94759.1 S-adenosylmethionine uptake transporter [Novosphingobium marinum]GGC37498.1 hypothetical protein GCM10011371_26260 [Novosphingobium marinum]
MPGAARLLPFLAVTLGLGMFSLMDAAMKSAAILGGVYTALVLRSLLGALLAAPVWLARRKAWPTRDALRVHLVRSAVVTAMAPLFFWGLVRIPMAEAIAISFIAPLIALYFASLLLGEVIRPSAIVASLLGVAGVAVIAGARFGDGGLSGEAGLGIAAILVSAVFYALNLVLQRRQALLASPYEIAVLQNLFVGLFLLPAAPWLAQVPGEAAMRDIVLGAAFAVLALLFLAWGYARAEAQALVPIEYTGFLWAALFGWLWFREPVGWATMAGALLIVAGSWIATRNPAARVNPASTSAS